MKHDLIIRSPYKGLCLVVCKKNPTLSPTLPPLPGSDFQPVHNPRPHTFMCTVWAHLRASSSDLALGGFPSNTYTGFMPDSRHRTVRLNMPCKWLCHRTGPNLLDGIPLGYQRLKWHPHCVGDFQ